jgi:hypothetical protein
LQKRSKDENDGGNDDSGQTLHGFSLAAVGHTRFNFQPGSNCSFFGWEKYTTGGLRQLKVCNAGSGPV